MHWHVTECGEVLGSRIVGGQPALTNEYKWMVGLTAATSALPAPTFCGGSLISDAYVLTAAHCTIYRNGV